MKKIIGRRTTEHPEWTVMCFHCLTSTKVKDLIFIKYKKYSDVYSEACPKCKCRWWYAVWDENGVRR